MDAAFSALVLKPTWLKVGVFFIAAVMIASMFAWHSFGALVAFLAIWGGLLAAQQLRIQFGLRSSLSFEASTGQSARWTGKSRNSDANMARLLADSPPCHVADIAASLFGSTLVSVALLVPMSLWLRVVGAFVVYWVARRLCRNFAAIELKAAQSGRDTRANETLAALIDGRTVDDCILYLRPFSVTGRVRAHEEKDLQTARER